jgi:hypothetical protein
MSVRPRVTRAVGPAGVTGELYKARSLGVCMSPKRAKPSKEPRGTQKWILAELRSLGPAASLSTSKLAKRIAKASGKKFHQNSIYLALRELTGRGAINATRVGLEKTYRLANDLDSSSKRSPPATEVSTVEATPEGGHLMPPTLAEPGVLAAMLPHKLALGEILVLSIGNGQVLTATNLHGRLALERHPLPPRES